MTSVTKCSCCGQVIMPKIRFSSPQQQAIWLFIDKRKTTLTERLIDHIYRDDTDGGPLSAAGVIHVQICRMNKILATHGMRIQGNNRGASYSLIESQA